MIISVFQFHLVRLKGFFLQICYYFYAISIPPGPIKSMCRKLLQLRSSIISIPPGPIKSQEWHESARCSIRFQFHLVRLKVIVFIYVFCSCVISIPPGPIKSSFFLSTVHHFIRFQFHRVRLKAVTYIGDWVFSGWFQFHLVRLKGFSAVLSNINLTDFNSTWSD